MPLPFELQKKIVDFLESLPNMSDGSSRRALIQRAGVDPGLLNLINFDKPPAQFFPSLVQILIDYGRLGDGRDALEAVIEAAKKFVGSDKSEYCESLIQEIRIHYQRDNHGVGSVTQGSKLSIWTLVKIGIIITVLSLSAYYLWHLWFQRLQSITYTGRVIDLSTKVPIQGAKIFLDTQGAPTIVYTDSEGIYRFTISLVESKFDTRIRIEASGYQSYRV